jgi:kynurenine formamidase
MKALPGLPLVLALSACAPPTDTIVAATVPTGAVIDLSHVYDASTIYWPTSDLFQMEVVSHGMTPGGFFYAANTFSTAEHGGTHLDAPIHFAEGRWTTDQIPVDRLVGAAVVVDVRDKADADADYQIAAGDLEGWEATHGRIPDDVILLLHTGFGARWPDAASYLGTAERGPGAVAKLHFPGLHPDAARWLVAERRIKAIGLDTASIDFGQSTLYESHRTLFDRNIPAFENLTNLDQLPATGAMVVALPMKIGGGSGGPLRAIALLPR